MRAMRRFWGLFFFLFVFVSSAPARADDEKEARELFVRGGKLAEDAQWAEALATFEKSAAMRPHPVTTFNIGLCERALGHLLVARRVFQQALTEDAGGQIPASIRGDIDAFVREIDASIAETQVTIAPADASIAVDGRPLEQDGAVFLAGTRAPGAAQPAPSTTFTLRLDPGAHTFIVTRKGFADAVARQSFRAGKNPPLALVVDALPGTLSIVSTISGAAVRIDGVDVGLVPQTITRPAGTYAVAVRKLGYQAYDTKVTLGPGGSARIDAPLKLESKPIYARWWFWTGAAVIVAGAIVITYFATRPSPQRPPIVMGGLGWGLEIP
jgi:hypothetical protein